MHVLSCLLWPVKWIVEAISGICYAIACCCDDDDDDGDPREYVGRSPA